MKHHTNYFVITFGYICAGEFSMLEIQFKNLGKISFEEGFSYQENLFKYNTDIKSGKIINGHLKNCFITCEHNHVITLGKSGDADNLLVNEKALAARGIEFFRTTRGGDITYHGPGQIVGYPILDLEQLKLSVKAYSEALEETIIQAISMFGLKGGRIPGMTGVWLDEKHPYKARKICAIGIKVSRYITMHGFAFNVNTDLRYFDLIIPCGINGKSVTSVQKELNMVINMTNAINYVKQSFEKVFGIKLVDDNNC